MLRFDFRPVLQGQTRIAKLKSAYNSLIIDPRGLRCETNLLEIMGWKFFLWSDLTLDPSFKVKRWFTGFGELSFWWIYVLLLNILLFLLSAILQ